MLRKVAPRPYKTMIRRLEATEAASAVKSHKAILQLVRFDPEKNATRVESYEYDKHHDYMVLDLLIAIKAHQDPTLAFRSSCCEGVCGSCAMNINGVNSLACISFARDVTTVGPLPNFPVIKDFVVDLRYFFQQYAFIRPFVRNASLKRNQIDNIVDRYKKLSWVMHGVNPDDVRERAQFTSAIPAISSPLSAAVATTPDGASSVAVEEPCESRVTATLRLIEALCQAGNVTHIISALDELENLGVSLGNDRVKQLIKDAFQSHAANKINA